MPLVDTRVLAPFRSSDDRCRDASGMRAHPEVVVLGVKEGVAPSAKPPVRIFLGTEPAQYRAERVFVWSIEQVRDPSRVYEIHLMKELAGFDRRRWLTGFTNYRYAIPHFAGGAGRAIWNDVDEIYLSDPAELFDTEMGEHGFLTIPRLSEKKKVDSSVMLMDCEKMLPVWPLESVQHELSRTLLDRAVAVPGLHGLLAPEWNSRDAEYVKGRSKLIHYTILHTQPWCPLPQIFVYQRNPVGEVWYELERSANAAGYCIFGPGHPSAQFRALRERLRAVHPGAERAPATPPTLSGLEDVRELAVRTDAGTALEYRLGNVDSGEDAPSGATESDSFSSLTGLTIARRDLVDTANDEGAQPEFDGVVCRDGLEYLPDADVPWVVEDLFARARRFVYARVDDAAPPRTLADGTELRTRSRGRSWWLPLFERVGARHPGVNWKIVLHGSSGAGRPTVEQREGGRALDAPPTVWVLTDDHPGHTAESMGLAAALGWPHETKALRFTWLSRLGALGNGLTRAPAGIDWRHSARLAPRWPDLVIASGRGPSGVARWIGRESGGRTRVVQLGRRAGQSADPFDIVVTNVDADLAPDPRRIETIAPLTGITPERLELVGDDRASIEDARHPRVVLLVGGITEHNRPSAERAHRMAYEVRAFADVAGGSVTALTTQRTGAAALAALREGLGDASCVKTTRAGDTETSRLADLAAADVIVVTGESESLLAEASGTGKPVYIYPPPRRRVGLRARLERWVETRAEACPLNRRGTVRPQQGLEYLCARLIERGLVVRPRNPDRLQRALIDRKVALPFGEPLCTDARPSLREAEEVARRIRPLLGYAVAS